MPTTLISTLQTAEYLQYSMTVTGESFIVTRTGAVYSTVGGFLSATADVRDTRVQIHGEFSIANWGQNIYLQGGDIIEISATGRLTLGSRGEYAGISVGHAAGNTRISNAGEISVANGTGIELRGGSNAVINTGSILAGSNGVELGEGGGILNVLTNSGIIAVNRASAFGDYFGYGVQAMGSQFRITNSGTISTSAEGIDGVGPDQNASAIIVQDGVTGGRIFNTGLLTATGGWGIRTDDLGPTGTLLTVNDGTISGGRGSYLSFGLGMDTIINRGTMIGNVLMGAGDDTFNGIGGEVAGLVHGGTGNDLFRVDDPTLEIVELTDQGTDLVEAAVDWVLGAAFENLTLLGAQDLNGTGNALANQLTGNAGANRMSGLGAIDRLDGGAGDDTLSGGVENDTVNGQDGDDRVLGGAGNDSVWGGNGDDVLFGGAGTDRLIGGADADRFVFQTIYQSSAVLALSDLITDFEIGADRIDLREIDAVAGGADDAFTFIGAGGFTGVAGQLRYVAGAQTQVQADVNGDMVADLIIRLNGNLTPGADDFVL